MGSRTVRRDFFHFVLPSMLAFALSGVYAIADGFFVGNALGDTALAAINIAYPLTALLQALGTGIGMGGAVRYSITMGTGNRKEGSRCFGLSLLLLAVAGLFLTLLLYVGAPYVLTLFGASGQMHRLAHEYLTFIAFGAVFQIFATGLTPFLRNMGSSIPAMAAMVAGFLTNIVLDYAFVWILPWGMAGAAVATVIGQAVTFLICGACLLAKKQRPSLPGKGQWGRLTGKILKVAVSPFGLTFSPNLTLILVNKSAVLTGGDQAVASYAAVSYISSVVLLLLQGISDGCQPLLSLSYGAGEFKKTSSVRNLAFFFSAAVALCSMAVLFLLRDRAALLFGASAQTAADVASILPIFLCGYLFAGFSRVTTAYFYATGKNLLSYLLIYGEPLCLALCLLSLPGMFHITGAWLSVPASQAFSALLSVFFLSWRQPRESEARSS